MSIRTGGPAGDCGPMDSAAPLRFAGWHELNHTGGDPSTSRRIQNLPHSTSKERLPAPAETTQSPAHSSSSESLCRQNGHPHPTHRTRRMPGSRNTGIHRIRRPRSIRHRSRMPTLSHNNPRCQRFCTKLNTSKPTERREERRSSSPSQGRR